MRSEKDIAKTDNSILLLVCDLQNVVTLPKAEVSSFFYKKKLTMYNLTAKISTKKGYCAVWNELISGRAGNDLASELIAILKQVISDQLGVEHIVCWSDSCVPQNRNSYISHDIIHFISENPAIKTISMTYSLPGSSGVQEVDNMHKQIDDVMKLTEFYSPLMFLRLLLKIDKKKPYKAIQMAYKDFKDYANCSKLLRYNLVPFTKVSQLRFVSDDRFTLHYKLSHSSKEFSSVFVGISKISRHTNMRSGLKLTSSIVLTPRMQKCERNLDEKKMKHLREMLKYIPLLAENIIRH